MKHCLTFILFAGLHILALSQPANTAYPSTDTTIYTIVEKQPEFFGGTACLFQHITNYLKRPEGELEHALSGTVYLTFVVEKNGKASNIKVIRGIAESKAFEEEAVKFVRTMPKWVPAEQNGKRVRARYNLPLKFRPQEEVPKDSILADGTRLVHHVTDSNTVFTVVDQGPEFPGGSEVLYKYVKEHVIYPVKAKKEGREGTCYLSFIVERDGSLTYVHVLRGAGEDLDEEALRLVRAMPKWIPGRHNGHALRVAFNLPILFRL